jgi:hypothetical protein
VNIGRVDSIRLYATWLNHRDSSATGGAVESLHIPGKAVVPRRSFAAPI